LISTLFFDLVQTAQMFQLYQKYFTKLDCFIKSSSKTFLKKTTLGNPIVKNQSLYHTQLLSSDLDFWEKVQID